MMRFLDVAISLMAVVLLVPVWLMIGLLIFLEDRGPLFFYQTRPGLHGKLFTLYKFRSMRVNSIPPLELGAVKHNHALVTRIGHFIRRTKLDETPQFINVLRGDMSLVGPRPCLPKRIETMTNLEKKRFTCLPGLTGWAEVNGNVELSWEEQLALDLWYVANRSLSLDFVILLKTILVVLFGSKRNEDVIRAARRGELCES